jgi:hypothetical protein
LNVKRQGIPHSIEETVSPGKTHSDIRKHQKSGRGFFLTLLVVSGLIILFLYALYFGGREIHSFTFKKFIINKAFVSLLPKEYSLDEAERVRLTVYHFYDNSKVHDPDLLQVSQRIQAIMADEKITDEEVQGLLSLIQEKEKR